MSERNASYQWYTDDNANYRTKRDGLSLEVGPDSLYNRFYYRVSIEDGTMIEHGYCGTIGEAVSACMDYFTIDAKMMRNNQRMLEVLTEIRDLLKKLVP